RQRRVVEQRYLTAASLLDDTPLTLDTASGVYVPRDYDQDYKGAVSVRTALAGSLNVPAVRALMLTGVETFRDRLNAFGFDGIDREGAWYGYSLALGSAEVSLWEQARAYRALARGGEVGELRVVPGASQVAPRRAALDTASFVVADILADRGARAVTFGLDSALATPYWSAVKTGTSKDLRDNWCIGFTRDYTVAVWVGNFEGDSMRGVSGVSGAAPAWREILDALQTGQPSRAPVAPPGLQRQSLRFAGTAELRREEWFLDGTAPGDTIRPVAAASRIARISNPVNGMVIAIDPDIPATVQRVPFTTDGVAPGHSLVLDDRPLGAIGKPVLWQPTRGAHRLALADANGRVLDRVFFTVR
ncbi:penicillin-binding protein 1C, partial [bacterium]